MGYTNRCDASGQRGVWSVRFEGRVYLQLGEMAQVILKPKGIRGLALGLPCKSPQDKSYGGCSIMKRLLSLISTLAIAAALSVPAFSAQPKGSKKSTETASPTEAQTKSKGKSHRLHLKKKGSTAGKKKAQASTTPSSGK